VLTARCLGSCGLAPAAVLDGAVLGKIGAKDLLARVEKGIRHDH
jgi:bidirectional [NiFe] hydrogenase diaphorase subunit